MDVVLASDKKKVTVLLPLQLWRKARILATARGETVTDVLTDALAAKVAEVEGKSITEILREEKREQ